MANLKRGKQSFIHPDSPVITAWASVAGKKEAEGPLAHTFDIKCRDTYFGQKTWEQAEKYMQQQALKKLSEKLDLSFPITLYVARHSWASIAQTEQIPLRVISAAMGHDSETTTQIYLSSIQTAQIDEANSKIMNSL